MSVSVLPGTGEYVLAAAGELHLQVQLLVASDGEEDEDAIISDLFSEGRESGGDANVSVTVLPGTGEYVLAATGELHLQVRKVS